MCNMNCLRWAANNLAREELKGKRILEVGSYDVNGSLRYVIGLTDIAEYTGVDVVEGPGVDIVSPAEKLVDRFGKDRFDIVVSTCVLEHIIDWRAAVSNIKNVCRPGGLILLILPSKWPFHEHPNDFWRYQLEDIRNIFSDCEILCMDDDAGSKKRNVYAKIRKPEGFVETNLGDYSLYSMVTDRRQRELRDRDFRSLRFHKFVLSGKMKALEKRLKNGLKKLRGRA